MPTIERRSILIHDQLNELIEQGEGDRKFQIMCCQNWRRFRDGEGLPDDLADYARDAFVNGTSDEQDRAIRGFPAEPLRLLRSVILQSLHCPNDPIPRPDPPIRLRFRAERAPKRPPSITVEMSADEAIVTLRAPDVL